MRALSLYICDRSKTLLFHRDWTTAVTDSTTAQNNFITLYGLFYQMKLFATAADPTKPVGEGPDCKSDGMRPTVIGDGTGFRSLSTSAYQLNFLEVPSGIKIVLNTSPGAGSLRALLQRLYAELVRYAAHGIREVLRSTSGAALLRALLERLYAALYVSQVVIDATHAPGEATHSLVFSDEVDALLTRAGLL